MDLYYIRRFKAASMSGSQEGDAVMDAGLFKTEEEALKECETRARKIFEWAKRSGKCDVSLFEGSNSNWCVEYKENKSDQFHTFWNYYVGVTYINE